MPALPPGESYPEGEDSAASAEQQRVLADTLEQIRAVLGPDIANEILPEGSILASVQTELYQSPELQAAHAALPGQYSASDRNLIILGLQDRRQVFLVGGKVKPRDPFDFEHTIGGGVDQRGIDRVIYVYDGVSSIKEYTQNSVRIYTGEQADPDFLLAYLRSTLGMLIATESLG